MISMAFLNLVVAKIVVQLMNQGLNILLLMIGVMIALTSLFKSITKLILNLCCSLGVVTCWSQHPFLFDRVELVLRRYK